MLDRRRRDGASPQTVQAGSAAGRRHPQYSLILCAENIGEPSNAELLPPMNRAERIERLRHALVVRECEAMLVTKLVNIRYLTGFTGTAAMLLVTPDTVLLVSDRRYGDQIAELVQDAPFDLISRIGDRAAQQTAVQHAAKPVPRLGFEASEVSWAQYGAFVDLFRDTTMVALDGLVEGLRSVKDKGEVARIERAGSIADRALTQVKPQLKESVTESDFAAELDFEMRLLGAEGSSCKTSVVSGPRGAQPHARPSDHLITEGELIRLDFGALFDGYGSDMTRMFLIGDPSQRDQELLAAVTASQEVGIQALRAGSTGGDIDRACRRSLAEAGYAEQFVHGTGHGVGLEIHETPLVGPASTTILEVGTVLTIEPGIYVRDYGGVRIEDTFVITEGGTRALTTSTKDICP